MGLGSGRISGGSRSLFGSISLPNLKASELTDALCNGIGQITGVMKKRTESKDKDVPARPIRNWYEKRHDMGAYGFESFQVDNGCEVFVRDAPAEEAFEQSQAEFVPVASAVAVEETLTPAEEPMAIEDDSADGVEVPTFEGVEAGSDEEFQAEELEEQPVIAVADGDAEAEKADIPGGEAPAANAVMDLSSLFGNIKRGISEKVGACVGCVRDVSAEEPAPRATPDDPETSMPAEGNLQDGAVADEDYLSSHVYPAPAEERVMLGPWKEKGEPVQPIAHMEDEAAGSQDFGTTSEETGSVPAAPSLPESEIESDAFADHLSFIPEESSWEAAPVWDVSDEASEAYTAFCSIRPEYPKAVPAVPEWDVKADTFADYLSFIPEESSWEVVPVWDISDETAEAYTAFCSIRPEYPKAAPTIPEWDVSEAAAEGLEGYRLAEEDYFRQHSMLVSATVSHAIIELDSIERHITDAVAAVSGMTGTVASTSGASELLIKVKDNPDINQESLQTVPEISEERKLRASRFVFRDGRLQKITEEIEPVADVPEAAGSSTVSEDQPEGPAVQEVIALPAAQSFGALPAPPEAAKGVSFSFGRSGKGCGPVRFSF